MERALAHQMDKILSESSNKTVEVIVRMERDLDRIRPAMDASVAALRKRRLATSPRDLLPKPREETERLKGLSAAVRKKHARSASESMAAQVALGMIQAVKKSALRKSAESALRPLLSSDVVKRALARTKGAKVHSSGARRVH